jgi:hypothetical protein
MTNSDDMTTVRFEDRPSGKLWRREPGTGWQDLVAELDEVWSDTGREYGYGYEMGRRDAIAGLPRMTRDEILACALGYYAEGYADGYHDAAPL